MTANKPATPLPWSISPDGRKWIYCDATKDHIFLGNAVTKTDGDDEIAVPNAAYIAHAANAYPKLVAALREYVNVVESVNNPNSFGVEVRDAGAPARALLRSLGEDV